MSKTVLSVAIDGPSGAGKSTIAKKIAKEIGFIYVSLDLQGYRTGSMNETLNLETLQKQGA